MSKIIDIENGVAMAEELQAELTLYKKDGKIRLFINS